MPENIERIFTIPLRKKWDGPRTQRANHAIKVIRKYVVRMIKDPEEKGKTVPEKNVWIDPKINQVIWARGRENPPRRIKVKAVYLPEEKIIGVEFLEEDKEVEGKEVRRIGEEERPAEAGLAKGEEGKENRDV